MLRALLVVPLLLAVGCYTEEPDPAYGAAPGAAPGYYGGAPAMEVVSPGVQVVAVDYDYPVFFSDGFYWRWYGGSWYSSRWYGGGWGVAYNVPVGVRGIDRPYAYAHYRAGTAGYIRANGVAPAYRGGEYRGGPAYRGGGPAYRGPVRSEAVRAAPAYHAPAARPAARHR